MPDCSQTVGHVLPICPVLKGLEWQSQRAQEIRAPSDRVTPHGHEDSDQRAQRNSASSDDVGVDQVVQLVEERLVV